MTATANATVSREKFLQSIGDAYDAAAERGAANQFTAHMLAASASFSQPAPESLVAVDTAVIGATDGADTLANAGDVFTGYLDGDFKNYGTDVPSEPVAAMSVTVYELKKDATFKEIFVPPPGKTLDDLCIPQSQIKKFCKDCPEKLRQGGYATLFLLKVDRPDRKDPEYFVAYVYVIERRLLAYVYRFDYPIVWLADRWRRVVVPQLQDTLPL